MQRCWTTWMKFANSEVLQPIDTEIYCRLAKCEVRECVKESEGKSVKEREQER